MAPAGTQSQILDAVLRVAARSGLSGLNMEAVAEEAAVSRQTVYRHFGTRDELIEQAILREEAVFIDAMLEAASGAEGLHDAVEAAVRTALGLARAHPVLSRIVGREPASLLPYMLLGRGPVISAAEPAVRDLVRSHRPRVDEDRLALVADASTRLLVSYVISPHPELSDGQIAMAVAVLAGELATPAVTGERRGAPDGRS